MCIVLHKVERYLQDLQPAPDPVRREMEALAARRGFPIVGPQVGALLALLTRTLRARRVLELGSGYGYSALWIARALPPEGRIHLTDGSEENLAQARAFLRRAGVLGRARLHQGDALTIATRLAGPFDLVFNDIDKEGYPEVVEPVVRWLRPGGLLITDNALWHGKVGGRRPDATTRGVEEYNHRVFSHPALETVILPLRDGVAVSRKRDVAVSAGRSAAR